MKEERRNKMICFHDPDKEYGFLSNWYSLIKEGRISSIKQGKKIIVPKVCLVEFLTNAGNYQTPSPTVPNNLWTYEDGCDSVGVAREDKGQLQKKGA